MKNSSQIIYMMTDVIVSLFREGHCLNFGWSESWIQSFWTNFKYYVIMIVFYYLHVDIILDEMVWEHEYEPQCVCVCRKCFWEPSTGVFLEDLNVEDTPQYWISKLNWVFILFWKEGVCCRHLQSCSHSPE